ncbi:MAG: (4Fe-4S)-binding protein [Longimicrobiales bacterium]|nr:(4Fe-4S)-binding protein [Longimicrobiales bacterium]
MSRLRSYEGDGITVRFDPKRCIHAEECVHGLPSVFDADKRPWIQPEGADADAVAQVIHECPSGALTYERTDGGPPEPVPDGPPEIRTAPDGPLYVRGSITIVDHEGNAIEAGPRVALCRCGASKNKPYCDNTHLETGFSDEA